MEARIIQLDDLTTPLGKQYLEDLLREIFLGIQKIETGEYEGTGSKVTVTLGWRPALVEVFFVDGGGTTVWTHDDIDPTAHYHGTNAGGAPGANYNISIIDTGFTADGSEIMANGETFFYRAVKTKTSP